MARDKQTVVGFGLADDGSKVQYAKLKFLESLDNHFPSARHELMELRPLVSVDHIVEMGIGPVEAIEYITNPEFAKIMPFSPEDEEMVMVMVNGMTCTQISRSAWSPLWEQIAPAIEIWLQKYCLETWAFMRDVALKTLVFNTCDALSSYPERWHVGPWESHHPFGFTTPTFMVDLTLETERQARARLMVEAKAAIEEAIAAAKMGFKTAPAKGNLDGIDWLVKYQVCGMSINEISAKASWTDHTHVSRHIKYWAEMLGVQIRPVSKGGRPTGSEPPLR